MGASSILVRFAVVLAAAAMLRCSEEGQSADGSICERAEEKLAECGLSYQEGTGCQSTPDCVWMCAFDATCEELENTPPESEYVRCATECSEASAEDFVCADGRGSVIPAAVCDGEEQCRDGSDEAECGAGDGGGAPDAATD